MAARANLFKIGLFVVIVFVVGAGVFALTHKELPTVLPPKANETKRSPSW